MFRDISVALRTKFEKNITVARKRKELPLLQNVEITGVAAEGQSLTRYNDMVVFIPFGAPGDIADVKIDRKKRNYAEGHIERMITPSEIRVEPRCEHFGTCGGCRWQHLPYEFQLDCKQTQVKDALERIAKVDLPEISPIKGSESIWEYRNKMEYTFSNKKWLTFDELRSGEEFTDRDAAGFHIPGAFDKVLDINRCHLQDDLGNRIRLFIKQYGKTNGYSFYDLRNQNGLLRTLMMRICSTGEVMVVMVFGEDDPDKINKLMTAIREQFPEITSLQYVHSGCFLLFSMFLRVPGRCRCLAHICTLTQIALDFVFNQPDHELLLRHVVTLQIVLDFLKQFLRHLECNRSHIAHVLILLDSQFRVKFVL